MVDYTDDNSLLARWNSPVVIPRCTYLEAYQKIERFFEGKRVQHMKMQLTRGTNETPPTPFLYIAIDRSGTSFILSEFERKSSLDIINSSWKKMIAGVQAVLALDLRRPFSDQLTFGTANTETIMNWDYLRANPADCRETDQPIILPGFQKPEIISSNDPDMPRTNPRANLSVVGGYGMPFKYE